MPSTNPEFQSVVVVQDPAQASEHERWLVRVGNANAVLLVALTWSPVALVVLLLVESWVRWPSIVVDLVTWAVGLVLLHRAGDAPGEVRLVGPLGDPLVLAVRRARNATATTQKAALRLTDEFADHLSTEAQVWASTLSTATWRMAQAAAEAPLSGVTRDRVAQMLTERAWAMASLAAAAEMTVWMEATGEALGEVDQFVAQAREAFGRLELAP